MESPPIRRAFLSMPDEILVRPARTEDLSGLLSLYHDLNPDDLTADPDLSENTFRQMLAHPGLTVLLALQETEPVGSVTVSILPNLTRGCASYALIENVVTLSTHRGRGIGERMMRAAIELCWAAGCFKIMLLSGEKNARAHAFYERLGFERSKTGFDLRQPGYAPRKIT